MFRNKGSKAPKYFEKTDEDTSKEFRAVLDESTSIVIVEKHDKVQILVKKELLDYKLEVVASEAPVKNYLLGGELLPFEYVFAERAILEQEIFTINRIINDLFGKNYDLRLKSIRLCIGADENNYFTIDENDLKEVDISPTINGLKSFIQANSKSVLGFTIRKYDNKRGNLIFCEAELSHPIFEIRSIKIKIISSLSQRGLYMQKHHQGYGLHIYYILQISDFTDPVIHFFNELKIPIDMIYLKRKSSIQNWRAIECEIDTKNMKNYLQYQYTSLSHSDVDQIVSIVQENKFNYGIANMMADLLNRMKVKRVEIEDGLFALEQEDFAAAAKVVVNYFGFNVEDLMLPKNLDSNVVEKSIAKLDEILQAIEVNSNIYE